MNEFVPARLTTGQISALVRKLGETFATLEIDDKLRTASDFRTAIKDAGMHIGESADQMLAMPAFARNQTREGEVTLVAVRPEEIGFTFREDQSIYQHPCSRLYARFVPVLSQYWSSTASSLQAPTSGRDAHRYHGPDW